MVRDVIHMGSVTTKLKTQLKPLECCYNGETETEGVEGEASRACGAKQPGPQSVAGPALHWCRVWGWG